MNAHTPPALSADDRSSAPLESPQTGLGAAMDIRRWFNVFRRRIRLFIAVALVVFAATVMLTLQATPRYTATASVVLDTRKTNVTGVQQVMSDMPTDASAVATEVEILKSGQLAERVVKALNLDQDPEFNPALRKPKGLGAVRASVRDLVKGAAPKTAPTPAQLQRAHEGVVSNVLGGLQIRRTGMTYVIAIGYESESPTKAAAIANKWAELYLLDQLESKFEATQQATRWLNEQLGSLRGQVEQDDAAVQQYRIANNLLSASGTSLTEQEISSYSQSLASARAELAADNARLATARQQLARGSNGEDVGEAMSSAVIGQLRSQRAAVSAQVADLQGRYGDRHPEMLKAKRQLTDIDSQIQEEIGRIVSNLEAKVEVSRQRANAVGGSLGGAKGTLASNSRAMVRLNELQRTADASRTLYESYLARYKETSTQGGIETSDARIVTKAKVPGGQSSPDVQGNLIRGLLLAIAAGAAALILAEMLDAGLATAEDVERRLETAYLGSVPMLSSVSDTRNETPIDHIVSKPLSSFSEAFRNLQTSILYAKLGEPVQVVAVTSSLPGEGKTTTAICLARSAALRGGRVLVVDCDLRRRTVNRMLDAEPGVGLLEVLSGDATLEQAISRDAASGADILPLSKTSFTPKDVFGTAAMDRLLAELRRRYDLVILDTAPVLPIADTRILAPKADVVVFLARWRKTPQHAIEAAFRQLSGTGAHVGGVVLTQVDMKQQAKYGYGDPGYYYAEYKKYYTE
ncbi:MAG: polysaccharide biosynthesis tyrosine autokinase [Phenylobacterium sp.]|uniref:GumC family protein n=1 Tax=Phenylobacterium sp. TaxID=1871053 RepID=UPI00273067EA|nr:polysaccharide biosynthesis tyrosine autokinase [Phenylobacterium sp.]MDP2012243.1 polysaccharide biosynthesis tyrosine autokinase [Phenylobacterium sp.]